MYIYIAGGSGQNGQLVIKEALSRGHTITALVRTPSSLSPHKNLTIIQGTPLSKSDVTKALTTPSTPDIVISTLAITRTSGSPFAPLHPNTTPTFISDTFTILLQTLKELSLSPKIVYNSSLGATPSLPSLILPMRMIFTHAKGMRAGIDEHGRVEKLVRESGLRFVVVKPCMLAAGGKKEVKVFGDDGKGIGLMPSITRESVAGWMVDAVEGTRWDGKAPVITN